MSRRRYVFGDYVKVNPDRGNEYGNQFFQVVSSTEREATIKNCATKDVLTFYHEHLYMDSDCVHATVSYRRGVAERNRRIGLNPSNENERGNGDDNYLGWR